MSVSPLKFSSELLASHLFRFTPREFGGGQGCLTYELLVGGVERHPDRPRDALDQRQSSHTWASRESRVRGDSSGAASSLRGGNRRGPAKVEFCSVGGPRRGVRVGRGRAGGGTVRAREGEGVPDEKCTEVECREKGTSIQSLRCRTTRAVQALSQPPPTRTPQNGTTSPHQEPAQPR